MSEKEKTIFALKYSLDVIQTLYKSMNQIAQSAYPMVRVNFEYPPTKCITDTLSELEAKI